MILVPIKSSYIPELTLMHDWCKLHIGEESPTTWFEVCSTRLKHYIQDDRTKPWSDAGLSWALVFTDHNDATAFKLKFEL